MSIPAIESVGAALATPAVAPVSGIGGVGQADAAAQVSGGGFAAALSHGISSLQATQAHADTLAVQAATGDLQDIHDYTVAAGEASLATSLTVAFRDKAVGAFNEIMRMQA